MVGVDPEVVEADLVAGVLACPDCGVRLAPWGSGRERELRSRRGGRRFRPRRSICAGCGVTHVLLPDDSLLRRRDAVADIGDALGAKAAGWGNRRIAKQLGRERGPVRGWLRRFAALAERVRGYFTRWAVALIDSSVAVTTAPTHGLGDVIARTSSALLIARPIVVASSTRIPLRDAATPGALHGALVEGRAPCTHPDFHRRPWSSTRSASGPSGRTFAD